MQVSGFFLCFQTTDGDSVNAGVIGMCIPGGSSLPSTIDVENDYIYASTYSDVMDMGLFWLQLQVNEVSGHVSAQNGSQICPSTPFLFYPVHSIWVFSNPFSGVYTQYHT